MPDFFMVVPEAMLLIAGSNRGGTAALRIIKIIRCVRLVRLIKMERLMNKQLKLLNSPMVLGVTRLSQPLTAFCC